MLGFFLFSIIISVMDVLKLEHSKIVQFADDTAIYLHSTIGSTICRRLTENLLKITRWFTEWKVKTVAVYFTKKGINPSSTSKEEECHGVTKKSTSQGGNEESKLADENTILTDEQEELKYRQERHKAAEDRSLIKQDVVGSSEHGLVHLKSADTRRNGNRNSVTNGRKQNRKPNQEDDKT